MIIVNFLFLLFASIIDEYKKCNGSFAMHKKHCTLSKVSFFSGMPVM